MRPPPPAARTPPGGEAGPDPARHDGGCSACPRAVAPVYAGGTAAPHVPSVPGSPGRGPQRHLPTREWLAARRATANTPRSPGASREVPLGGLRRRSAVLGAWGLAILGFLALRLGDIQIVHAKTLSAAALAEHLHAIPIPASRGEIVAHNGQVLALDVPAAKVTADPRLVKNPSTEARQLAALLNVPETTILQKLEAKSQYAVLEPQATGAQGNAVSALNLAGIYVQTFQVRRYPAGFFMGHILGFVNNVGGVAGVEESYQRQLAGTNGYTLAQTGVYGELIPGTTLQQVPARQGETLQLTVRPGLQAELQRELEVAVATTQASQAYGIVLQPSTGAILAASSWPTFDPNSAGGVSPSVIWTDTVQSYNLPPGSVFKPVTVAAALQAGIVQPGTPFVDPGVLRVDGVSIHNFQKLETNTTFSRAFDESANVVFGTVGLELGAARFDSVLRAFGLFSKPGSDLPGESSNQLWSPSTINALALASESFGESMSVTPLSLITALNVVADGGLLIRPHVGDALLNSAGQVVQKIQPQVVRRVISPQIAATIRQMMVGVVNDGTGERGFIPCYDAAGKTGTSNIYKNGKTTNSFIASFVDMAPASNPQAIVLVMLYHPQGYFTEGGEVAAPVAQAVLSDALHTLGVPPHCTATNQMPPKPGSAGTTSLVLNMVEMPTITGLSPAQATTVIQRTNLTLQLSGTGATVVTQNPPPGAMVQKWTQVEAYTTPQALEPAGYVQVPAVSGQTIAQAAATLTAANLTMVADGVGTAVSQEPPAGSRAQPGTSVQVQFSEPKAAGTG